MSVMSRTKAREIALHLIFEMGFQQFEEENLNERLDEEIMKSISGDIALYAGKLSEEQTAYIRAVVKGRGKRPAGARYHYRGQFQGLVAQPSVPHDDRGTASGAL